MLRMLIINMVLTFILASLAVWGIYEFDLFLVKGPQVVSRERAKPKRAQSRLSRGRVVMRAPLPKAIPAHDLTGREFGRSPLPLSLPVDCEPGVDCWVFNYVDTDPGKDYADFACGRMSYDAHKGTDIAFAHTGRLNDRIAVRAAADGRVLGVRDGMRDISVRLIGRAAVKGKECGNGVRVDHGGGWHTQYCHMKRRSISVRRGDMVRAGERLGAVGLSGRTEFPHLHISVEKSGKVIDPFVGIEGGERNAILGSHPFGGARFSKNCATSRGFLITWALRITCPRPGRSAQAGWAPSRFRPHHPLWSSGRRWRG